MARYRVLSLDGGGIRGLITAILLARLDTEKDLHGWLERADLVAGTSTGGLIALALARGASLAQIRALYEERGRSIFDDSWLDNVKDFGTILGAVFQLIGDILGFVGAILGAIF